MNRLQKVLAIAAGVLGTAVALVVVRFYVLSPRSRPAPSLQIHPTSELAARGKYIVENVAACVGCHSPVHDDQPGDAPVRERLASGRDFGVFEGFPAHLRAPNLTPDPDTGIGNLTDGELARAIREGIGHDGRALFPQMPYTTYAATLSDEDVSAVIVYLRSLPPIKNDPGRTSVDFPVSMFIRAVPQPLETPPPPSPAPEDKLARGRWLLQVCSCHDCHDSVDAKMAKIPGKELGGGMKLPLGGGKGTAVAPNISSDKATGIGAYSDEDLRRAFDKGRNKQGRLMYAMPWAAYQGLTDDDKDALIAALRREPAVVNAVPSSDIH